MSCGLPMPGLTSVVVLLCGFAAFNSPPSNGLADARDYQYHFYQYQFFQQYSYRVVIRNRYRTYGMNLLKTRYRAYAFSSLGVAGPYHRMYSYTSRLLGWRIETTYSTSRQCVNLETNTDGDFIGFFDCPLFFEPKNFTYCCGEQKSHYCCPNASKATPYTSDPKLYDPSEAAPLTLSDFILISLGVIGGVGALGGIIAGLYCCILAAKRPTVRPAVAHNNVCQAPIPGAAHIIVPPPGHPYTSVLYTSPNGSGGAYPRQMVAVELGAIRSADMFPYVEAAPPAYSELPPAPPRTHPPPRKGV